MQEHTHTREMIQKRYAEAARRSAAGDHAQARALETGCCAEPSTATPNPQGEVVFGADLYQPDHTAGPLADAVAASLGCGVPTAVADLHPGDIVLDLGSGGGADVLISARRVAPHGRAIGLDMTPEMVELARRNAAAAGVPNVEFVEGYMEQIPLADDSVDAVISNCVINLAADKSKVLAEAARVLRPGGRFAVSDVIADTELNETPTAGMQRSVGCVAGALTREQFEWSLADAGFVDVEIAETHRVDAHHSAAIVRGRMPA